MATDLCVNSSEFLFFMKGSTIPTKSVVSGVRKWGVVVMRGGERRMFMQIQASPQWLGHRMFIYQLEINVRN